LRDSSGTAVPNATASRIAKRIWLSLKIDETG